MSRPYRVEPEDCLEPFEEREDRGEPLTSAEVADRVGIARRTAHKKLEVLVDRGNLKTKEVGARGRVWWVPVPRADTVDESERERRETPATLPPDQSPSPEHPPHHAENTDALEEHDPADDTDTDTEPAFDVPGSGEKAERRREAVEAALEYIREQGEAKPADLREEIYPDHTGDYASGRSWWKNCVYPALRDLAEDDVRLEKADTTGRWSWNA